MRIRPAHWCLVLSAEHVERTANLSQLRGERGKQEPGMSGGTRRYEHQRQRQPGA